MKSPLKTAIKKLSKNSSSNLLSKSSVFPHYFPSEMCLSKKGLFEKYTLAFVVKDPGHKKLQLNHGVIEPRPLGSKTFRLLLINITEVYRAFRNS